MQAHYYSVYSDSDRSWTMHDFFVSKLLQMCSLISSEGDQFKSNYNGSALFTMTILHEILVGTHILNLPHLVRVCGEYLHMESWYTISSTGTNCNRTLLGDHLGCQCCRAKTWPKHDGFSYWPPFFSWQFRFKGVLRAPQSPRVPNNDSLCPKTSKGIGVSEELSK